MVMIGTRDDTETMKTVKRAGTETIETETGIAIVNTVIATTDIVTSGHGDAVDHGHLNGERKSGVGETSLVTAIKHTYCTQSWDDLMRCLILCREQGQRE